MRSLALAPIALALIARAAAAFECPARGGANWREYRTDHFVVDTDVGGDGAPALLARLERLHALLVKALVNEEIDIPGHVRVIAFADRGTFNEFAGDNLAGFYTHGQYGEPTIVFAWPRFQSDPAVIAHELAHHLSFFLFPVQPRWFSEGIAQFVENVITGVRDNTPAVGSHIVVGTRTETGGVGLAPDWVSRALAYDPRPVKVRDLFAWKGREDSLNPGRYHLWSWLLYHYLWNNRSKQFSEYQKRMMDTGDPEASWAAAFPDLQPANEPALRALDDRLESYSRSGRYAFYRVEAHPELHSREVRLSTADLHLYLNGVRRAPQDDAKRKAVEHDALLEAVAEDPAHPVVLLELADRDPARAEAVRKAALARPSDARSWLVLSALEKGDAKVAALRKAVELDPDSAFAANNLAWELVSAGKANEAVPFANKALDLAPWSSAHMDTLAEVALQLGKCPEALTLGRRAVAASGGEERWQKRSAEFEARCARPSGK